jgi:WD40 repeat protein
VIDVASKTSLGGTTVGHVNKVTRHPSRPLLYASSESGVLELDPESGDILRRFSQNSWGHVVTPDGTRLYAVSFLGEVTVWNLDTGVQERSLPGVRGTDLTISPDGRFLYVLLGSDFTVGGSKLRIVDPTSGIVLRTVDLGGLARRIAMLPDGTAIISNYGGDVGWVDFVR